MSYNATICDTKAFFFSLYCLFYIYNFKMWFFYALRRSLQKVPYRFIFAQVSFFNHLFLLLGLVSSHVKIQKRLLHAQRVFKQKTDSIESSNLEKGKSAHLSCSHLWIEDLQGVLYIKTSKPPIFFHKYQRFLTFCCKRFFYIKNSYSLSLELEEHLWL